MKIPSDIYQLKGIEAGPTVTVLGGVHGDELAGIQVVKKLLQLFNIRENTSGLIIETDQIKGTLNLGFGNPEAIKKGTRLAGNGLDLNRQFDPKFLNAEPKETDGPEIIRARELEPILNQTDYLIDLHATSSPSKPFIIAGGVNLARMQELTQFLNCKYILIDPTNIYTSYLGLRMVGATDGYVNCFSDTKGVGFCYETGYNKDISLVETVYENVLDILVYTGTTTEKFSASGAGKKYTQTVYVLKAIVTAKSDKFKYKEGMAQGWSQVTAGQVLGVYADGTKEIIKEDGMLLFPSGEERIKEGESLYYLAEKQEE